MMMEDNKDSSDKQTHRRRRSKKAQTVDAIETLRGGETTTRHIPGEIIEEILVRLPVKSLLRFKCAAKTWLASISSPEFIKAHVNYSTNLDPTFSNYRHVPAFSNGRYRDDENACLVGFVLSDFRTDDQQTNNQTFCIGGSCNGLLCVYVYDRGVQDVFLWNPCLTMSKKLRLPCANTENVKSEYRIICDERSDDYEVVRLSSPRKHGDHLVEAKLEIYNLKDDSWRRIEGFKGGRLGPLSCMVYANRKLHFLAPCESNDLSIVSFDLENEVYGTIEHLEGEQKERYSYACVGVLKGCIAALYSFERDHADLWVLKEYGVKESWTKLVSIPYVDGPSLSANCRIPYSLCSLWNGKYLLRRKSHLIVYDPEDGSFVYHSVMRGNLGDLHGIDLVSIYVESLVPLL